MLPRDQNRRAQRPGKGATEGRPTGWALQLSVEGAGPRGRCEQVRGTPDLAGLGRARGLAQGATVTAVPAKAVPRLCPAGWRGSKSAHRWGISGAPLPGRRFQSQARGPRAPSRRNRQKLRVLGPQAPENTAPRTVSGEPGLYQRGGGVLAPWPRPPPVGTDSTSPQAAQPKDGFEEEHLFLECELDHSDAGKLQ